MPPLIYDYVRRAGSMLSHLIFMFDMLVLLLLLGIIWRINKGLTRMRSQDTKPVLLLEWHATPKRTLSVINTKKPAIFTFHPLFFKSFAHSSKWLWDFNNTRFRPLFLRDFMAMQFAGMVAKKPKLLVGRGISWCCSSANVFW